jgi:hypothetical protein
MPRTTEEVEQQSEALLYCGDISLSNVVAARVEDLTPIAYRLRRLPPVLAGTPEIILQGAFQWTQGFNHCGVEWRDIPTVDE